MSDKPISEKMLHDPSDTSDSSLLAGPADDELTGHEYDGIQEYDNPLPGWWKWLFAATIVFSFPYWGFYHFGATGRSVIDAHAVAEAEVDRLLLAEMGELKPDRATLVSLMNKDVGVSVGASIYKTNCTQCHGKDGEGVVGPNLTDDHYKNIREIDDILSVINNGAAGGAMPAWLNRLGEAERILVSAYVAHLRGSLPAGSGKAAEGRVIDPWPTPQDVEAEAGTEQAEGERADGAEEGKLEDTATDEVAVN